MATKDERIIEIIVNGQKANANLKEMEGAARALSSQLKTLAPGTAEFVAKSAELRTVQARYQGVKDSIAGVTKETSLMRDGIMKSAAGLVGSLGVLDLWFRGIDFIKESIAEFKETKQANAGLDASLKSTGQAAGIARKDVDELAASLQKTTLFKDDMTKNAAALLLTFTNIKKGVFEEALPAIEDMATKMANGGEVDLKSASIQVGKALNDPIKGITALARVGVSFSESQKEVIKHMVETGDRAGAQKLILAELNKEFGGSAAAARKAAGGGADFNMQMHDIRIELGQLAGQGKGLVMPFIVDFLKRMLTVVGVLKEVPGFVRENKELFIALGVAIITLNAANISATASTLAQLAVERSRAVATRASAAAQWLLNAAMEANPIGLIIAGIALVVGGFIKLYNSSQSVRAGIAGFAAAAVGFFDSLKKVAIQSLGGLADLLQGVFTFDMAQIKRGAAALKDSFNTVGKDTAAAFHAGYKGKVDEEAATAKALRDAANKKKVTEAGEQGTAEAEEETIAQRKAREKAAKEAEKARKKAAADKLKEARQHQAEVERAQKEFHAATLKADYEFEKLKVEAMEEGIDKVLAKLKLERDEELRGLEEKRKATLANVAASNADKLHLVEQYAETAALAQERYVTKAKEARLKQKQEDEKDAERDRRDKFARMEQDEAEQEVLRENQFMKESAQLKKQSQAALKAEHDRDVALLNLRKQLAQQELALLVAAGKGETAEAQKLRNAILKVEGQLSDGTIEYRTRTKELEMGLLNEALDNQKAGLGIAIDLLGQDAEARKEHAGLIKAFTIAQIIIDTEKEIAGYMATADSIASFGVSGFIKSGLAVARAAISISKVSSQEFARGGYTGAGQGRRDNTGFRVAGTVHEGEWVAPKWMLETPKYANIVGYLEAERKGYATGGYTPGTPALPPSAAGGGSQADAETAALLRQLIGSMDRYQAEVATWANNLQVDYHAGNAQQAMELRNKLKSQSGL